MLYRPVSSNGRSGVAAKVFVYKYIQTQKKVSPVIVKTRAVVLREVKYRDQSKICLLLTREFGQISVILKAVRNPKNRMSGLFSAGNVLDTVIYRKSGRDIQLASDASLVLSPMASTPDLERFSVLYRVLDLARHSSGPEEKNLPLFSLLFSTIERLCASGGPFMPILAWFLLRLAGVLGFEPSIERCAHSGRELLPAIREEGLRELHFLQDPGGFALPGTAPSGFAPARPVHADQYLVVCALATGEGLDILRTASPEQVSALCDILQEYCTRHLERVPRSRHLDIVSRLLTA